MQCECASVSPVACADVCSEPLSPKSGAKFPTDLMAAFPRAGQR